MSVLRSHRCVPRMHCAENKTQTRFYIFLSFVLWVIWLTFDSDILTTIFLSIIEPSTHHTSGPFWIAVHTAGSQQDTFGLYIVLFFPTVKSEDTEEEPNFFFTMAELKACNGPWPSFILHSVVLFCSLLLQHGFTWPPDGSPSQLHLVHWPTTSRMKHWLL